MEPHPNNPKPVQSFLKRWAVTTLAVVAADILCAGIEIKDLTGVIIAPLVLGLLNAFMRPLLLLLSLPLLILTLGIFLWVINALLLLFTSHLAGDHFTPKIPNDILGRAYEYEARIIEQLNLMAGLLQPSHRCPGHPLPRPRRAPPPRPPK